MELVLVLGVVVVGLLLGYGTACYQWGHWKAKRDLLEIAASKQRKATEALAGGVDPAGRELLDGLQDPDG